MAAFDETDVAAAGMACGLGKAHAGGAHLTQRQCAAVVALAARLQRAENLIAIAADVIAGAPLNQRHFVQDRLRDFVDEPLSVAQRG